MKTLGLTLMLIGVLIAGAGALLAVLEIGSLYQTVASDPMAEPEIAEEDRSGRILWRVGGGAIGLPPLVCGFVLWRTGKARDKARRERQRTREREDAKWSHAAGMPPLPPRDPS